MGPIMLGDGILVNHKFIDLSIPPPDTCIGYLDLKKSQDLGTALFETHDFSCLTNSGPGIFREVPSIIPPPLPNYELIVWMGPDTPSLRLALLI